MFLVSITGLSVMPDIIMCTDAVGKTINGHHFSHNRNRFVILVSTTVF